MSSAIRRGVFALLVAMLVAVSAVPGAWASFRFCKPDPYIVVNGRFAHIWVASPEAILAASKAPVEVEIAVPRGATYALIGADNGFGFGYNVRFVERDELSLSPEHADIVVSVLVPADRTLPAIVEITSDEDERLEWQAGSTNNWIVATTAL